MIDVDSVTFTEEGLAITYIDQDEIRVGGKVRVAHQIQLHHSHPDYRDDARALAELARSVVANALEDWRSTPSHQDPVDEDDDRGMGE